MACAFGLEACKQYIGYKSSPLGFCETGMLDSHGVNTCPPIGRTASFGGHFFNLNMDNG